MTKAKETNRYVPVIASVAIQLCIGVAYLWSVFQTGIADSIFGGNNIQANLTFAFLLFSITVGSILGGKLAETITTQNVIILGGIILSIGFFLASYVTAAMPKALWVTYSAMGGLGMGITYSTTISCAQKWFPDKKGLVTGIIVSAMGLGGVIFTPLIEMLIKKFGGSGVGEQKTFLVLSVIFLFVCTIGGLFLKTPPDDYYDNFKSLQSQKVISKNYKPSEIIKIPQFYLISITLMFACMGGLVIIGFAKPIAVGKGLAETATVGVLLVSIFNTAGRLVCGMVSDKIGRINTIIILLCGTGVSCLLINWANGNLFFIVVSLIGFFYGGFLSTFPALIADLWGIKNMATNYGMVLLGYGVGAIISSLIAGYYKNLAVNDISLMLPAYLVSAAFAFVAIILITITSKLNKKQLK